MSEQRRHMLEMEALQLAMTSPQVAQVVKDADLATASFSPAERGELINALRTSPSASQSLKRFLNSVPSSSPCAAQSCRSHPQRYLRRSPPNSPTTAPVALTQTLVQMLATAGELTSDERTLIVEQALVMLENVYVHLPFKRAMHAIDPVQNLKLLQQRMAAISERDFHDEMIFIFTHLRDLHTNYILPEPYQSRTAFLPFRIEEFFDGQVRRISSPK